MDTHILNPTARRVAAVGSTIRRGLLFTLTDLRSAHNRYLLKTANILGRTPRAKNTQAEIYNQEYLKSKGYDAHSWRAKAVYAQLDVWVAKSKAAYNKNGEK